MSLFVLGLFLLVASVVAVVVVRALRRPSTERPVIAPVVRRFVSLGAFAGVALGLLLTISSFVRVVPANTVGIPTTLGKVGSPFLSGFHVTVPWTEITEFSTRTQELSMLKASDEGDLKKDDSVRVIAAGGGSMSVDVTVRFSLAQDKADSLFKQAGSLDLVKERFVRPETREVVRDIFGAYTAEEGYSTKRAEIATKITDDLKTRLAARGVLIDNVNVRDVEPEAGVLAAINGILQSRNEAARALEDQKKQVTEANTRKQVAELDKDAAVTKAQADAQAVTIAAEAEAGANQKIAASLTPELVDLMKTQACAEAIKGTGAQVINVCSGGATSGGTGAAPTSVIVDSRTG
jgi:regulator of protease activity HflC (stomatin/prohibitin superfamily)